MTTNNASFRRSPAARQHVQMSALRAVEEGRWVLHAAISGITAVVDPEGRIVNAPVSSKQAVVRRTSTRRRAAPSTADSVSRSSSASWRFGGGRGRSSRRRAWSAGVAAAATSKREVELWGAEEALRPTSIPSRYAPSRDSTWVGTWNRRTPRRRTRRLRIPSVAPTRTAREGTRDPSDLQRSRHDRRGDRTSSRPPRTSTSCRRRHTRRTEPATSPIGSRRGSRASRVMHRPTQGGPRARLSRGVPRWAGPGLRRAARDGLGSLPRSRRRRAAASPARRRRTS